jgi:hypothetical protein
VLPSLKTLNLYSNKIGEAGMRALATALEKGGLPSIKDLILVSNPGSSAPVDEVLRKRA